ncbi:MAG: PEGA domain-containing protein [Spartobacteria bacterium]|nr:PEGA domain-containing protein [Spartobacteria bacterium]
MASQWSLSNAVDSAFVPANPLPAGLTLDSAGYISGIPTLAGTYNPTFVVQNTSWPQYITAKNIPITIQENANKRPVIDSFTPTNQTIVLPAQSTQTFAVVAHDPESGSVTYSWWKNGSQVSTADSYDAITTWTNGGESWTLQCYVNDDLWSNIVETTWNITVDADNDDDGMPNTYEVEYPGSLDPWVADATNDLDSDFANNLLEYQNGSNPTNRDTNGDGLLDGWQIQYGSDPTTSTNAIAAFDFERIGSYRSGESGYNLVVSSNIAYVSSYSALSLIDVSSPTNPQPLSTYSVMGSVGDVAIVGNRAFAIVNSMYLHILDISSPSTPSLLGIYTNWVGNNLYSVAALSETSVVVGAQNLIQLDVSDPQNISIVTNIENGVDHHSLSIDGTRLYSASTVSETNYIFDISSGVIDPIGAVESTEGYYGVAAAGSVAVYATSWNGIDTYNVDNPTNAQYLENYSANPQVAVDVNGLKIDSNLVYVANGSAGLQVVDISDPAHMQCAGEWKGSDFYYNSAVDVDVANGSIYLLDRNFGLQIIQKGAALDSDQDGMLDSWEMQWFSNLTQTATGDYDNDGIINIGEAHGSLNPTLADQDKDGVEDGDEVETYNSSPMLTDSDWDNLTDSNEVFSTYGYATAAYKWDTDADLASDWQEIQLGRNPLNASDGGSNAVVSGTITGLSNVLANAQVKYVSKLGGIIRTTYTDTSGVYRIELIGGHYNVKASADGYASEWLQDVNMSTNATLQNYASDSTTANVNFDLALGQSPALLNVESEPTGAQVYIDYRPTDQTTPALVDVGQADGASTMYQVASHTVTLYKKGSPRPAIKGIRAEQAEVTDVSFDLTETNNVGSIYVNTEPAGADVYVDYADRKVGVTPLTIFNVAPGSHTVLLRKNGMLQPRPVRAGVASNETTFVSVPLTSTNDAEGLKVNVKSIPSGADVYVDYLDTELTTDAAILIMGNAMNAERSRMDSGT